MDKTKYSGYTILNEEQAAAFFSEDTSELNALENEYFISGNEIYCYQEGKYRRVAYQTIANGWNGEIKPKDVYQAAAVDMLNDERSKVKLIRGCYGSGKTFLVFNWALSKLEHGDYKKIVFVRPNVSLKNVPEIGFLPGEVSDKLKWVYAPLYDKVGGEFGIEQLEQKGWLEMIPLLFIRGRSFENSIVLVEEAQNIDTEIAKVLLSRIGKDSVLICDGDFHQTDNRIFDKDNGLAAMVDKLSGNPLFATVYLPTTHRGEVAELASLLDE